MNTKPGAYSLFFEEMQEVCKVKAQVAQNLQYQKFHVKYLMTIDCHFQMVVLNELILKVKCYTKSLNETLVRDFINFRVSLLNVT